MFVTDQVKAHGYENGIREFFIERKLNYQQLMLLSKASEDCPWYPHRSLPPDKVIRAVFAPLQDQMAEMINLLAENCMEVLCLQADGIWYLLYVIQMWESDYYLWIGREPAENPPLSPEAAQAGWGLPEALQAFYQVHHGFGESDLTYANQVDQRLWHAGSIRPAHRLEPLTWQTEGDSDTPYQPGEILFFFHDGGEDYYGILKNSGLTAYYNSNENYIEDSLAGDFTALLNEYFSEMFL
jgi:hypothetical protein